MRVLVLLLTALAQDSGWQTAKDLPSVDTTGLSAAQKQSVLKLLRENGCTCGCSMKIAQCRVEDPKCSYSRSLAAMAVRGVKDGKSAVEIAKQLAEGPGPAALLEDPIPMHTDGAPVRGPADARITLVEFSDFQCPYCSKAVLEIDEVLKAFPKDVKLIYKQFPLTDLHERAMLASQAAVAAQAQGKFWPMHDKLFANNKKLTRDNMFQWAREMGLDMKRFAADIDSPKTKQQIAQDMKDGDAANVDGTPSVFVNGKHYNGSLDPKEFGEVLKAELKPGKH